MNQFIRWKDFDSVLEVSVHGQMAPLFLGLWQGSTSQQLHVVEEDSVNVKGARKQTDRQGLHS
jgi:hypothetical protein